MRRWILGFAMLLVLALGAAALWVTGINDYRTSGRLELAVLTAPVTVTRDARGVAHIAAQNRRDMLRAQGFITAQDRLFQMEFFRMLAWGRLSELLGDDGISSDTQMRVIGLPQNARRMAAQFAPEVRRFLGDYLDGVNAYIATQEREFPLELSLLGHRPQPWTLEDSAIILQYVSLQHSVNLQAEAVALALVDTVGAEKAASLMPVNVNPDRRPEALPVPFRDPFATLGAGRGDSAPLQLARRETPVARTALHEVLAPLHLGSNNWVVGPERSASGAAVVVNDPHLDARLLPGVWYPIGLSSADFHATGVALPAIPGVIVGRTDRVAFGVTNAYGDVQDLFLEQVDPSSAAHYLEGDTPVPFEMREETLRIRDDEAPDGFRETSITIRSTRRGPVITDHGLVDLGDRVVSLKWAAATAFGPEIGFDKLFFARSAAQVDAAARQIDIHMFNIVFADVDGNFGRRATGRIPIRRIGRGALPVVVTDSGPYWTSWIPKNQMPGEFNPERGWTGTANHDTRPSGYPYSYSTYFSPSYRYRRLAQLLGGKDAVSLEDHWDYMHDVRNLQAARMAPVLEPLLRASGHQDLADTLRDWSYDDVADGHAPLLYQTLYRELALATFEDELGPALCGEMLDNWYLWQERFDELVLAGDAIWFDNIDTAEHREGLVHVVATAADAAKARLSEGAANSPWGDAHRLSFVSPLRRSGLGSAWVGGGDYPMSGSGETLRRARYRFTEPFDTAFFASYQFVSDMSQSEEILSALPGGVAARVLHKHYASQIPDWHAEKATVTPLSRAAAQAAATSTLTLEPGI